MSSFSRTGGDRKREDVKSYKGMEDAVIQVHLLGPVRVELDGQRIDVQRALEVALVARLALEPTRVVPNERLVDDLWGERLPRNPMGNLQGLVYRLRAHLAAAGAALRLDGNGYVLDVAPDNVDSSRFETLVAQSRRDTGQDHLQDKRAVLGEALALWNGRALAGLDVPFVPAQRARLEAARLMALQERIDVDLASGGHREVVGELEGLVVEHPDEERFWAQLMLALYRSGSQGGALRACARLRRHLVEALGVNPSPEITELEKAILLQDPAIAWPPSPAPQAMPTGRRQARVTSTPETESGTTPLAFAPPDEQIGGDETFVEIIRAARRAAPRKRSSPPHFLPLVGRDEELASLLGLMEGPGQASGPGFAVVVGEPGIGKSRLLNEFAARARSRQGLVVETSAEDDEVLPYRPFADLVREVLASSVASAFLDELGPLVTDLAWLVPKASKRPQPPVTDVGLARLRLFEAVVELAQAAAVHQHLVFVVDDAHRMSSETASLLALLFERAMNGRMTVILAARREVGSRSRGFRELLHRLSPAVIPVSPLSPTQIGELLLLWPNALGPENAALPDADELYDQTRGVPLLLGAVLSGQPVDQFGDGPLDIGHLVAARTRLLSPGVREMLQVAALMGPDVDADLIATVTRGEARLVKRALDRVVEGGGLLDEANSDNGYIWHHPLVREAVINSLDAPSLRQFREAVGDAWEGQGEALRAARQALDVFEMIEMTTRRLLSTVLAGIDEAIRELAFELAEDLCHHGLAHCDRRADPTTAVALLNRMGTSLAYRGRREDAADAWREAAQTARDANEPALLAEVALATEPYARSTVDFPLRWGLLNEVLAEVKAFNPPVQVRVISAWVNESTLNHHGLLEPALMERALTVARETGDGPLVATALTASYNARKAVREVPAAVSSELCEVADRMGDTVWQCQAHLAALIDAVTMADVVQAERHLAMFLQAADANSSPRARWEASMVRSTWALLRGDEDGSDRHAEASLETGQRYGIEDATLAFAVHMFFRSFHEGTLDRLAAPLMQFAKQHPEFLAWRAGAGLALAAAGDQETAKAVLDEIVPQIVRSGVDPTWPVAACVTAQLCWDCGGRPEQADLLLEALANYPGKVAVLGRFIGECGPVARYLGLLAARALDHRARQWLKSAAEEDEQLVGRLWAKRAREDLEAVI
jgi:DNA-binding SARP family transcriptional activator